MRYHVSLNTQRGVKLLEAEAAAAAAAGLTDLASDFEAAASLARQQRDVLARWGRYPDRNAALGRDSTPEEEAGLKDGSIPQFVL